MPSIEAQLDLEKEMLDKGALSYDQQLRKAEQKGRGADTDYARRLMQELIPPLIEALEKFTTSTGPGARGKTRGLLRRISPEKAILIALKGVFNSFTMQAKVVSIASSIGRMIEDEIRFSRFQEMHGDYYDSIIKDFKRKGTKDYRFMHRVLTHSANTQMDQWISWSAAERVDVGTRLIDLILTNTDLMQKVIIKNKLRSEALLLPTESAKAWVDNHEELSKLLFPSKMPCIIQPDPWTDLDQGGYYSPAMRQSTPMVKASGPLHRKLLKLVHARGGLDRVMAALNKVQSVAWDVNPDVLSVVKTVWAQNLSIGMPPSEKLTPPPNPVQAKKEDMTPAELERFADWKREASEIYTQEKERVSQCFQVSRIVKMANQYSMHDGVWFVWYADFRGRLYSATAGFSPQGPDLAKGVLRFREGKPLGPRGLYWLKVHGANRYGYDKVSYDERIKWVDDRHEEFLNAAADPLSHRETWAGADKPWQFLAFLFEYAGAYALKALGRSEEDFVSRLPIGLDGSCNGLQNFSAMLRDERGAEATNLVPSEKPADIYNEVAKVCYAKLAGKDLLEPGSTSEWLAFCSKHGNDNIPRSMAKRPVMTLPYGATRQSCTKYIFQSILETDREHFPDGTFKAACELTPYLWSAIGDVVVAAREGMDWLQKCASAMTKVKKPVIWYASDGFPIVQFSRVIKSVQIDTQLAGRFQIRVGTITDEIDGPKQRSGIAPNFVHSQDAAHLRATVLLAEESGIQSLACIHDDYGTHAADTDELQRCIRQAFVQEYRDRDPLGELAAVQASMGGVVPALPAKGTLDIERVLASPYFFG